MTRRAVEWTGDMRDCEGKESQRYGKLWTGYLRFCTELWCNGIDMQCLVSGRKGQDLSEDVGCRKCTDMTGNVVRRHATGRLIVEPPLFIFTNKTKGGQQCPRKN